MVLDNSGIGGRFLSGDARAVVEDVSKWIGIVAWLMTALWHFRTEVTTAIEARKPPVA